MREARKNHGLVVVNNRIYAVGGQGPLGNCDHRRDQYGLVNCTSGQLLYKDVFVFLKVDWIQWNIMTLPATSGELPHQCHGGA